MKRRQFVAMFVSAPFMLRYSRVHAGGWATIRLLDPMPDVVSGEPFTIRFGLYLHDMTERSIGGMAASVALKHRESGEVTRFSLPGRDTDDPGYEIELLAEEAGAYKWSIQLDPYPAMPMPTLYVRESGAEATPNVVEQSGNVTAGVAMHHEMYLPASVTISPGDTVRWTNDDSMAHQVAWTSIDLDDSALIEPGEGHIVTFRTPGSYSYYCGPHPWMTGVVEVRK